MSDTVLIANGCVIYVSCFMLTFVIFTAKWHYTDRQLWDVSMLCWTGVLCSKAVSRL